MKNDIIYHMPQLTELAFDISYFIQHKSLVYIPSNEQFQTTFDDFYDIQVNTSVTHLLERECSVFCICSHPYKLRTQDWSFMIALFVKRT